MDLSGTPQKKNIFSGKFEKNKGNFRNETPLLDLNPLPKNSGFAPEFMAILGHKQRLMKLGSGNWALCMRYMHSLKLRHSMSLKGS